jgi:plastocyanin
MGLLSLALAGCIPTFGGTYGPDPAPTPNQGPAPPISTERTGSDPEPVAGVDMAPAVLPDLAGPPASSGSLALMTGSTSFALRMNEKVTADLTVVPSGSFSGVVTYAASNLPPGVTATFDPPGGMLSSPATVKLTLSSASDAQPVAGKALSVQATSGAISATLPLTLDLKAELLVTIPKGVDIGTMAAPNLTAFGAQSIPTLFVAPGTKVTFVNADTINHEIHSDGTLGVAHEGGQLMAGGANSYTQTFSGTGTLQFRCHIHPNMLGQIVVKAQ